VNTTGITWCTSCLQIGEWSEKSAVNGTELNLNGCFELKIPFLDAKMALSPLSETHSTVPFQVCLERDGSQSIGVRLFR
jgi:hypothetical protein